MSVLLVHHQPADATVLAKALGAAGYTATIESEVPDQVDPAWEAIVVGAAGDPQRRIAVCQRLRAGGYVGAILAVCSEPTEAERFVEAGADDFAAAPLQANELIARVRVAVRRVASRTLRWGPLEVERMQRSVRLNGRELALTAREFALLTCLLDAGGRSLSRTELVSKVWGRDPGSNLVEVHLSRLRDKLGDDAVLIETVRGSGYRLRR